jgi:F0F1-type ATP synthase membrane subunit c/vacuolar-type H+-ATPase subunit K
MAKPQIILEIETYADGVLVDKTVKEVKREPDWFSRIFLAIVIPAGFWLMVMQGAF